MRRASLLCGILLLAAACGSMGGGVGDIGDIILGSPSSTQSSDVQGYVDTIDTRNQRIDLDVTYINNLRQTSSSNQRGTIYYDSRTRVVFQGKDYRPEDLERGDQISVRGVNNNGRYVAETIEVLRDVSG